MVSVSFDEGVGWTSPTTTAASFSPGEPLQAVSVYRDRVDIFGLEPGGYVDWQGWTTQFQGITQPTCNSEFNCGSVQEQ